MNHPFPPIYEVSSKVLILGSFPSVKSRATGFYYGHPQNRFWKVISALTECPVPETIEEKTKLLLDHHIALWDVLASCDVIGSSDASIRNAVGNDIAALIAATRINTICLNGNAAAALYRKMNPEFAGIRVMRLPSTSAANAARKLDDLIKDWSVIK